MPCSRKVLLQWQYLKLRYPSSQNPMAKKLQILAPQPSAVLAEHRDTARNWQPRLSRTRYIFLLGPAVSSLGIPNRTAIYAKIPWEPIQPPIEEQ